MTLAKGACSLVLLGVALVALGAAPMSGRSLALLTASGLLGIALGDTFFFRALQGMGPLPLLVLAVLGQVLTVALAVAFLGERPGPGAVAGIFFVLVGVTAVMRATMSGDGMRTQARALVFGILSVVCMAASDVIAKEALGPESDTVQATFVRMLAGTVGILAVGPSLRRVGGWMRPFREHKLAGRFVAAVAVVTFGGFWLKMVAFKYSSVAVASTLTSTEPVFALLIAALLLRERVPVLAVIGTGVTFAGVVFLTVPEAAQALRDRLGWFG